MIGTVYCFVMISLVTQYAAAFNYEKFDFIYATRSYYVPLLVGSNEQKNGALFDTGSWTLWLVNANHNTCKEKNGCSLGSFNASQSSTFHNTSQKTTIGYIGASYSDGWIVNDTFHLSSGKEINGFEFDLFSNVSGPGIFGFSGYSPEPKTNFIGYAKEQGVIDKEAFSFHLENSTTTNGSLILGGIDKAKYEGDLTYFTRQSLGYRGNSKVLYALAARVETLTLASGQSVDVGNRTIVVDSGSQTILLPEAVVEKLGLSTSLETPISCADFVDGKENEVVTIRVQGRDFFIPYPEAFYRNSNGKCYSYITAGPAVLLGSLFLQNAYFATNIETETYGIAPLKKTNESNIVDFWF